MILYTLVTSAMHDEKGRIAVVKRVQTGQDFGNYRLVEQLGEGGFAEVYLAVHRYLKHQAAIKILLMELTGDDKVSKRFLKEAQTMTSLDHPHIVSCLDFGIENHIPYLVMEYAPGGTLRDRYPEGEIVPLDTAITYVQQVASALQYAHDQGVVHLDVKPENILLGTDGQALLSDFGLARLTQHVSARVTSLVGTISYMAPEYIQRKPQAASDQYSLALIAYEWLTGIRPFDGEDQRMIAGQQLQMQPLALREHVPHLPAAVDDVVLAALAKDPGERYPRVSEFAEALLLASQASPAPDTSVLVPEKPETLYKEGLKAKGQGKLEQAKQLLEELQMRAPMYRQDVVSAQLAQVEEALHPQLLARARAEAEEANRDGQWAQEIASWNTFLQLDPPTRAETQEAVKRLRLAREHQSHEHLYEDAAQMLAEHNKAGAQQLFQQLYDQDPYYGDPSGLAKKARMRVPLTYQQAQAQWKKEEEREERQEEEEAAQEKRQAFVEKAYGPQMGKMWVAWVVWFLLVWGIGATVGSVTQSWFWAIIGMVAAAALQWGLGYRKVLAWLPLGILLGMSMVCALALTFFLAHLDYVRPIVIPYTTTVSTGFFTSKDVTNYTQAFLWKQLYFGLLGGGGMALVGVALAIFQKLPFGEEHEKSWSGSLPSGLYGVYRSQPNSRSKKSAYLSLIRLFWIALAVVGGGMFIWAIIGFAAASTGGGFGFEAGQEMAWLGLGLGWVLGIGAGGSLPIWWAALRQWWQ